MNEIQPWGQFLIPYIISQFIALLILVSAIQGWNLTRWLLALMFTYAGFYNLYIGLNTPDEYLNFSDYALPVYQKFINGPFKQINHIIIPAIAMAQLCIAVGFTLNGKWYKLACFGAIIFLLAICPLLFGAAFPFPLIVIVAIWILIGKNDHLSLWRSRKNIQTVQ